MCLPVATLHESVEASGQGDAQSPCLLTYALPRLEVPPIASVGIEKIRRQLPPPIEGIVVDCGHFSGLVLGTDESDTRNSYLLHFLSFGLGKEVLS